VPGLLLPLSALGQYVTGGGSWAERVPATDPVLSDRIGRAGRTSAIDPLAAANDSG
jgi:hypothetical protein